MQKKKLKEFRAYCQVLQRTLVYDKFKKFEEDFYNLKNDNENEWIEIHYKIIDKAIHFFHRYYRAGLLPALAQSQGIREQIKIHTHLKREYLYQKIESGNLADIPARYLTGVKIALVEEKNLYHTDIPSGTTIIVIKDNVIIGVIPSHATITNKEMEDFIRMCEQTYTGAIDLKIPSELLELRNEAYDIMYEESLKEEQEIEEQGEMFQ